MSRLRRENGGLRCVLSRAIMAGQENKDVDCIGKGVPLEPPMKATPSFAIHCQSIRPSNASDVSELVVSFE